MANILLVEDDEKILKMLSLRLRLKGHRIDQAENGQIGVEKALTGQFDAVLMDMHMPILDGHEATKKLRSENYRGLIIAVTASVMSRETDVAIEAGCDGFIAKPITADFETRVEEFISNFELQDSDQT